MGVCRFCGYEHFNPSNLCFLLYHAAGGRLQVPFIATPAFNNEDEPNDVRVLTLLDPLNPGAKESFFGFTLNTPSNPTPVARFRHWQDFSTFTNLAIADYLGTANPVGLVVDIRYNGNVMPSRMELDLAFTYPPRPLGFSLDSQNLVLGDLADISVTASSLSISGSIQADTTFALGLGSTPDEAIQVPGKFTCFPGVPTHAPSSSPTTAPSTSLKPSAALSSAPSRNEGPTTSPSSAPSPAPSLSSVPSAAPTPFFFDCDTNLPGFDFDLTYMQDGVENTESGVIGGCDAANLCSPEQVIMAIFPSAALFAPEDDPVLIQDSKIFIRFASTVTKVDLKFKKNCVPPDGVPVDLLATQEYQPVNDVFECTSPLTSVAIANYLGLTDFSASKSSFYFGIGKTTLTGTLDLAGTTNIDANVGGVIEASAVLAADLTVVVDVVINVTDDMDGAMDGYLEAGNWVGNLAAILTDDPAAGFFSAGAIISGGVSGTVTPGAPFDQLAFPAEAISASVTATLDPPFEIDFLDISASRRPNFNIATDFPKLGDMKNLSFDNIIQMLEFALEMLVGNEDDGDSVETCSGGLLGTEIAGAAVFQTPLPGAYKNLLTYSYSTYIRCVQYCCYYNSYDVLLEFFAVISVK